MSYCINPDCPQPGDPTNRDRNDCLHCGSSLVILNRYCVLKLVNDNSGFAKIYEVEEQGVHKILKILKKTHNDNPKAVELFRQEAVVLGRLNHPGIPTVESPGYFQYLPKNSEDPIHCFVMEKIDGPNLREWMLQQGNLLISEHQALDWLRQIAEILHQVHQQNYFHRDIKLQNIMIRSTGQLVLIDFGTAREMTYTYLASVGNSGNVTRVSSAGYTPPEQQNGHAVPQSDFYALGRTFVYLLTGKQLEDHEIYDPYTDEFHWRDHAADISVEFADFIDYLMAQRAADRPKDTQEILTAIARLKQTLHEHAAIRGLERLPTTEIQLSPDSPTIPQEYQQEESSPSPWVLGVILPFLLVVGAYGGFQAYQWVTPLLTQEQPNRKQGNIAVAIAKTLTGHQSFVNTVVISPDSQLLMSASADKTIKIWELETGKLQKTLTGHTSFVNDLIISPDGNYIISASADKTIKIWQLETGKLHQTLNGHNGFVDKVLISADGETLVSTGADKTVRIWDFPTGQPRYTFKDHSGFVNALVISSDGETLVTGSADKTIKIWNLNTGKSLNTLTGHRSFINTLVLSPDGQLLASGSADKTIKLWDISTGEELQTLTDHTGFINDLAISPDGQFLVSASADKTLGIWQLNHGELLHTLTRHENYVNSIKISQNGQFLVSSSADQSIRFWDLETGQEMKILEGYNHHIDYFAISPDGRFIATGSGDKNIAIWQVEV